MTADLWGSTATVVPTRGLHPVPVVLEPPLVEPLTLDQAKLRAGLNWAATDPRDALMQGFIAAARAKLEQDTEVALLTQTRAIYYDAVPAVLQLPVRPLQTATVAILLTDGSEAAIDPTTYTVDLPGGRLAFGAVTLPATMRAFQPWVITVTAGYADVASLPPELVQIVGVLTAHYATLGRDLALLDTAVEIPYGYDDLIGPWRPVLLP
jgi:uncharacterized phiE125 gp8 family phage protein